MSPTAVVALAIRSGFPRVSGDEPTPAAPVYNINVFSPRERG